jgi:hypothetical protein
MCWQSSAHQVLACCASTQALATTEQKHYGVCFQRELCHRLKAQPLAWSRALAHLHPSAALMCRCDRRCQATPIWDQQQQQMVLPPFDPTNINSWQVMGYERLCAMPDKQILQYCSTSPDHEPPWFPQGGWVAGIT